VRYIGLHLYFIVSTSHLPFCQAQDSGAESRRVPLIQKIELLNGLKVIEVQRVPAPKVALFLLIKAGSAWDPPEKMGTAYLTAESLFFANQKETPEHLKEVMDNLGVEFKIRVDPDATVFEAEVPLLNLETLLSLWRSIVMHPLFQQEGINRIKREIQESKMKLTYPLELAKARFSNLIFGKHPYANAVSGNLYSRENIGRDDLDAFYQTHYIPNNAAIVLVGEITPSQVAAMVRERFGGWTKGLKMEMQYPEIASRERFTMSIVENRSQEDAILFFGHVGPPRATSDFYALKVMNLIIGGLSRSSRLERGFLARNINYRTLKSEFLFYQSGGEFQVTAQVPSDSAGPSLQALTDILDAFKNSRVTESELTAAKASLGEWHAEVLNSPSRVADQVTSMELYNLANDFLISFPKKVEQVTVDRVEEAAKSYLNTSRASAVIVGAGDRLMTDLKKFGPVEVTESP